jgi:cytochrome P450
MSTTDLQTLEAYERFCNGRLADPYPLFHRLRREDPVHWNERLNSWMLTRYDDVLAASRDPRMASDRASVNMSALPEPQRTKFSTLGEHVSNWLGFTDPPKHTRMRKLVMKDFTPKLAEDMRERIQQIVDTLLDKVERKGQMDLVNDFAYPLPATVICEILGIPGENQEQFRRWTEDITMFVGGVGPSLVRVADQAEKSRQELTRLFRELTLQRRREPRQDLLSALAAVEGKDEGLTEQELMGLLVFLFVAGHETTVGLIANGMLLLLQNRSELERLKRDPSLMETAIEEFLRYESPIQIDTRLPNDDIEMRGRHIHKGQAVMIVRAAANRDPAQFPDPDRLDVGRQNNKHLAFGWGIHFCLGAPLACIEAQTAVKTILDRLPEIRLRSEDVVWWENMVLRCPQSLPVVF